jgi:hypothetical protein
LPFAGYFIAQGVPVFIDGWAELYGEAFVMAYYRAMQLEDVNVLLDLLKTYDIDAVVLTPATPAVSFTSAPGQIAGLEATIPQDDSTCDNHLCASFTNCGDSRSVGRRFRCVSLLPAR